MRRKIPKKTYIKERMNKVQKHLIVFMFCMTLVLAGISKYFNKTPSQLILALFALGGGTVLIYIYAEWLLRKKLKDQEYVIVRK